MSEQAETDRLGCALWEAQETEDRRYRSILDLERFLLRIKIEQSYIANPYFKSSIPKHMKELQRFYMEVEIIKDVIRGNSVDNPGITKRHMDPSSGRMYKQNGQTIRQTQAEMP